MKLRVYETDNGFGYEVTGHLGELVENGDGYYTRTEARDAGRVAALDAIRKG